MISKILFLLILLVCVLAYSSSLSGDFVWDDIPQIVENPYIKDISNIPLYFKKRLWALTLIQLEGPSYYRPLFLSSLAFDYRILGLNPLGYRITNLSLHLIIIFFVYLIAYMVLRDKTTALISSAVFALHPANTEVVAWVSGRTDMVAGIFLLPAFFLHYKRQYYFSMPLFVLALLSKETSIIFPLLIACYGIVNGKNFSGILKEITPYLILIIIYLAIRSIVLAGYTGELAFTPAKFILLAKAIPHYFRFLIYPVPMVFLPSDAIPKTLPLDIIGMIIFIAIIAFLFKKNGKIVVFPLLLIIFTLLPTLATLFIPSQNSFGYRFLYLPSIGYAMIIGILASNIIKDTEKPKRYAALFVVILTLLLYSFIVYAKGFDWRSTIALWENSLKYFPDSAHVHQSLAGFESDLEKEIYHYKMAAALDPNSPDSAIGLGTAYAKKGSYSLAKEYIIKGLNLADISASASIGYNTLGNIYYLEGKIFEAEKMYRNAIEIDKFMAFAYYNLARVLEKTNRHEEASVYMKEYETLNALLSENSK